MALQRVLILLAVLLPAVALRNRRASPGNVPPPEYESWSAADKVSWWKSHLDVGAGGSTQVASWWRDPDSSSCMKEECIHLGGKRTRDDVVPNYACRKKGLHPEGMVAFVKAVWEDNPYTGMFQGSDFGFARFGYQTASGKLWNLSHYAEEYAAGRYKPQPVPGNLDECHIKDCMNVTKPPRYSESLLEEGEHPDKGQYLGLKFFRDGVPSANMHLGPQSDPTANFVSRIYSNFMQIMPGDDINAFNSSLSRGGMSAQGTLRATRWPTFTGMHDMAMYDQKGRLQHDINFPWQVILFPSSETEGKIPENVMGFWPTLVKKHQVVKPGTTLFNIYAKHSLEAPLKKIGRLELVSEFMLSADTDRQVFFNHPRYERDLVLRPDLTEGYSCRDNWFCPLCPTFKDFCTPNASTLATWLAQVHYRMEHSDTVHGSGTDYNRLGTPSKSAKHLHGHAASCGFSDELHDANGRPEEQSALDTAMRSDDWAVEPLTGLLHAPNWFCAGDGEWPNTPLGPRGLAKNCSFALVPWHMKQEPEYTVEPSCKSLPACTKTDGTWYSSTYPCLCGTSTCATGQLCMGRTSTCTPWGPYANAGKAQP